MPMRSAIAVIDRFITLTNKHSPSAAQQRPSDIPGHWNDPVGRDSCDFAGG